ncbi:hypothetical protein GGR57DRAFT_92964 [Xylariaceae sp. FL1272]|nr:hypothetical protein GGR57DRAFT_92964 [Xylariaceae sp. FL1272]
MRSILPSQLRPSAIIRPTLLKLPACRYRPNDLRNSYSSPSNYTIKNVATIQDSGAATSLQSIPDLPLHLPQFHQLPAITTWFTTKPEDSATSLTDRLASYADTVVSYELTLEPASNTSNPPAKSSVECLKDFLDWINNNDTDNSSRESLQTLLTDIIQSSTGEGSRFRSFEYTLDLIIQAIRFNNSRTGPSDRIKQLYVAQSDIRSLPFSLRDDLPTPQIITCIGKGDIYGSSIWLGLQPTYTPLHRDPNPNLFFQLVGEKAVRLIPPRMGDSVYADVRRKLGSSGNSRFRGTEMMDGPERDGLHRAVWVEPSPSKGFVQAVLKPGDALFIPKGWWHSVTSLGSPGDLNASANWWFR